MRSSTIFLSVVACVFFLGAGGAFMQSDSRPRLGRPQNSEPKIAQPDALPQTYLNPNRLHKLIISDKEGDIYGRLARANAIRNEVDYGSYKLVVVDEEALGGRAALQATPVAFHDEQNMIIFNGYLIDTSAAQPLSKELPEDLKFSRMSQATAKAASPGKGLYVIQFIGPVQDPWLKELEQAGVEIIAYAPHNAYVVFAGERAAGELMKMKAGSPFVQWMGDYQPAYKLTPRLQAARQGDASRLVRVTVQVIDNAEGELKAGELRASARQYFGARRVLKYLNLRLEIPVSQLAELARGDEVFAIEEDADRARLDEAQGQIVAGNLAGAAPSGPGYLAWLASKGFSSSQFSSFAVNVVDDTPALRGHPDLPDSRIAFENNPTNQLDIPHQHGFLNAHIIGGFNDGVGTAFEDANGFNYGLGIVPWARVGVTAIFGFRLGTSPSLWEETAYGQGARISSNSWGLIDTSTGLPITRYDVNAQEFDSIVRDAQSGAPGNQQLTVVFAAGNDGPALNTVSSPGSAKNVITVGASENVRPTGTDGCGIDNSGADSADDIAFFSSRGPVNPAGGDGRIKPDIVAPGTHIQAGVPQLSFFTGICDVQYPPLQFLYSWSSGTSHSTPAVAGGAALIYQDFLNKEMGAPSPAMIKAVLMNSASYLTGAGAGDNLPSNVQGMGLMNLGRAFDGAPRLLTDQTRMLGSSGETYHVTGSVASSSQPFRVTLAWADAPGSTTGAPWVNNLDLEVRINGQVYKGNVFSGPNSTTGGAPDGKNNVESVFLPDGLSGDFLVTVRATNIAGDGAPGNADLTDQDFALVIYNANAAPPSSPIIEVSPTPLNFRTAAGANPPPQSVNINNVGAGALNWEASDDVSWLTISPASGAAPSVLTAAVNAAGLSAGTYRATITIRSTNAFNTPVIVPVTLTVLPAFEVNPSSLDIIAPLGGGNPQDQIISISHNDDRFRDWTASDDAHWLTVNPASGVTPSQLSASIDIRGLALGAYKGTITIRSTNPSIPPITVPVTLTIDGVFNGGFESAVSPWVFSGVAMRSTGGSAHSGTGYLLLGGADSSSGAASQQINLPRGSSPKLSFWLNVSSSETAMTTNDRLFIEVCDKSGKTLKTLAAFSNLNRSGPGEYTMRGGYSLAQFTGRPVRIQFRTTTDAASVTAFRIDSVSVK
jgi:subtilase family protein/BACON domain-containing protein